MNVRSLPVLVGVALLAALPLSARDLTPEELAGLETRIDAFQSALIEEDFQTVVGIIPPRFLAAIAEQAGLSPADTVEALVQQMNNAMAGVVVSDFEDETDNLDAQDALLEDGTETLWTIVPYAATIDSGGTVQRSSQSMLAVREAGTWYLLRVEDSDALARLVPFYPFLEGVTIPPGLLEVVE